ncbi:MAG: T9SS type A sorting domain-containing protein [Bergeyella sp.]
MKKNYLAFLCLFGTLAVFAQDTKTLWQKDIESSSQDFLSSMTPTIDHQMLISGSSIKKQDIASGTKTQNSGYDYHIVKLSQEGKMLWEKYFGGSRHDYLASGIATQEGGFLLAGTSYSNQSGDKKEHNTGGSDVWIIRLNENGDELWQKTIGTKDNDEVSAAVESTDGSFFAAGNISSGNELFGSKDVFVSKLDEKGNLITTTILGGKGLDEVQELIATPDGGSLLLVYSRSGITENKLFSKADFGSPNSSNPLNKKENYGADLFDSLSNDESESETQAELIGKTEAGFGEGDYWIVKLDKNAKIEWQKTYGGNGDDRPKTIAFTGNGYLIGGESRSDASGNKRETIEEGTDLWLILLDHDGNEQWQKSYSFGNRDVLMSMNTIWKTNKDNFSEDKGFLLGGYTQAEGKRESNDEKFWMLYIDNNGKEEWRKYAEGKEAKKEERLVSAKLQSDGTFLLAGTSADQLGEENWKIVKLGDKKLDELIEQRDMRIYPNPVEEYCYVEIGASLFDESNGNEEAEIFVYDMSGRQFQSLKTHHQVTKINTSSLPQGVYIVTAKTRIKTVNAKIVKK